MTPVAPTSLYRPRPRPRTLLHAAINENQSLNEIKNIFQAQRCTLMDTDMKGRFPIHVAVKRHRADLIEFLMPKPGDYPNAHNLARKGVSLLEISANKGAIACGAEIKRVAKELYPDNPYLNPPEGFALAGGGAKGIAYAGGVRALARNNMLDSCLRVAGTSAGAITATLIAVGCSAEQIEEIVASTDGVAFFDIHFTALELGGLCKGEAFIDWLEDIIFTQTGHHHCTFGELAEKVRQDKSFKHLHVFASRMAGCSVMWDVARYCVNDKGKVMHFHSENSKWKNLIISEAVRASMSLPLVYTPQILIFKDSDVNSMTYGKFYAEGRNVLFYDSYSKLKLFLFHHNLSFRKYLDGGLVPYNYPLDAFDKGKYIDPGCLANRKQIKVNPRVIGLKLSKDPKNEIKDKRTITVDTCGIGTGAFWTNSGEGSGKQAIEECDRVVQLYFDRKAAEVAGIIGKQTPTKIDQNHSPLVYPTETESMALFFTNIHTHGGSFLGPLKSVGAFALGCFPPVALIKITQCAVNSLSFQKSEKRKEFRALQYYNRGLKVFDLLEAGSRAKADRLFKEYKSFFNSSQVHRPLMEHLVYQNNSTYIEFLAKKRIPVNVKPEGEISLIHHALEMECYASFKALLKAADDCLDEALLDAEGNTVLHAIAKTYDSHAFNILKAEPEKFNALVRVKNASGETAFQIAAGKGFGAVVEALLNKDVNLKGRCINGNTILHNIVVKMPHLFAAFTSKASLELPSIIREENRIATKDKALIFRTKDEKILKTLMKNGIDVHYTDKEDKHLLYNWAKDNQLGLAKNFCRALAHYPLQEKLAILNHEATSNAWSFIKANYLDKTPLIIAAQFDNYKIVELLMREGADCTSQVDGYTPLQYAKGKSKSALLEHIKTLTTHKRPS